MRVLRVLLGAILAALIASLLWVTGLVPPPEGLRRRVVAFVTIYPAPISAAEVERIECRPLERRRFYVVCTEGCEGEWRIAGVTGLRVESIGNLNRVPREDEEEMRSRLNRFIAREQLELDAEGARAMIACHMRVAGLRPELILTADALAALTRARASEGAMRRLEESLDREGTGAMIVREMADGFTARFPYWDAGRLGRPVLEVTYRIARDGRLLDVQAIGPIVREGGAESSPP